MVGCPSQHSTRQLSASHLPDSSPSEVPAEPVASAVAVVEPHASRDASHPSATSSQKTGRGSPPALDSTWRFSLVIAARMLA